MAVMTPHASRARREVGIRELHDQLSRYVGEVATGEEIVVTSRGRPVARLVPIDDAPDPLAELRARGLVREPTQPRRRADGRDRPTPTGSVSELVIDERRSRS
jgi:prevent-host-death family protein